MRSPQPFTPSSYLTLSLPPVPPPLKMDTHTHTHTHTHKSQTPCFPMNCNCRMNVLASGLSAWTICPICMKDRQDKVGMSRNLGRPSTAQVTLLKASCTPQVTFAVPCTCKICETQSNVLRPVHSFAQRAGAARVRLGLHQPIVEWSSACCSAQQVPPWSE